MFTADDRRALAAVPPEGWERLETYADLLNRARDIGLVGFSDIPLEILRSLLFLQTAPEHLAAIADVGTGAGLPGLAIACATGLRVTLIEPRERAVDFLSDCVPTLGLDVAVLRMGAEQAAADRRETFSWVIARAVAHPAVSLELCAPLTAVGGRTTVTYGTGKGPTLSQESARLLGLSPPLLEEYAGPRDLRYRLLVADKVKSTERRFPRQPGAARRKPLS